MKYIELTEKKYCFNSISIYRNLLNDKVLKSFYKLLDCIGYVNCDNIDKFIKYYNKFYFELIKNNISLTEYIIDLILFDENSFSINCEKDNTEFINKIKPAVNIDILNLQILSQIKSEEIKKYIKDNNKLSDFNNYLIDCLPAWENNLIIKESRNYITAIKNIFLNATEWNSCVDALYSFHKVYGCGIFSKYRAFTFEKSKNSFYLKGIEKPDRVKFTDLIGYENERSRIVENTISLINGFSSNNILLYGDRGTGKSSTIKAILNEYYNRGLRLIEIPKSQLVNLPYIINLLKNRALKFIIFIDDLAFEDNEEAYTALKSILEGGIENRPSNVVIYATSNRRHLIKEKFVDRQGLNSGNKEEEIHSADTIQEKMSLADRFGITIVYTSPDKNKYLSIVDGIAKKRGIVIDSSILHSEALKWEIWYNGRSPRTAHQFIDWLEADLALKNK